MGPIYLRALELDDLDRTHQWHNDSELYATLTGTFHFVSRATEEDWLRRKNAASPHEINLAICLTIDSRHIGNIYLQDIDWIARHAALGIFIGEPAYRSKGYGREATRQIITYAFRQLGLARIYLYVLTDNERAIEMYKKCGLSVEGNLRNHAFKDGIFKDILIMGVCVGDLIQGNGREPVPSGDSA